MDLFEQLDNRPGNLLPYEGTVNYYGPIMSRRDADQYFDSLMSEIPWRNDEAVIYGRRIITRRKVAWHADLPASYTYSNTTRTALPWTPVLLMLKDLVQSVSGETYNSCLLNLYHDGSEGMAWHSDAETDLKPNGAIGSLSFGAERKFAFKHKRTKETVSKFLQHGSLLVMRGATQRYWKHGINKERLPCGPRVSLTFRRIFT